MLNTPIDLPAMSTILRPPGGISSTVATTWLANRRLELWLWVEPVQGHGVFAHDPAAHLGVEPRRERLGRRIEVPVWVVGGEHDAVAHVQMAEQRLEVGR